MPYHIHLAVIGEESGDCAARFAHGIGHLGSLVFIVAICACAVEGVSIVPEGTQTDVGAKLLKLQPELKT